MQLYEKIERDGEVLFREIKDEPSALASRLGADYKYLLSIIRDPKLTLECLRIIRENQ